MKERTQEGLTTVMDVLHEKYGKELEVADPFRVYGQIEEDFYMKLNGFEVEGLDKVTTDGLYLCLKDGLLSLDNSVHLHEMTSRNTGNLNVNIKDLGTALYVADVRGRISAEYWKRKGEEKI